MTRVLKGTMPLTVEEFKVLRRILYQLTGESQWLNSKWRRCASPHEALVIDRIANRLRDQDAGPPRNLKGDGT